MDITLICSAFLAFAIPRCSAEMQSNDSAFKDNEDMECRKYHSFHNASDICKFVNTTDDCKMDEGFVNYIHYALCDVDPKLLPAVYVLYTVWLLYLFIALGTTAESFFCPALEFIAHNLKLSQNIAGITVVAFGNGAPDIFSAVAAFTNSNPGSSGVAIGALLGAGVFVTTVVAGAVSISRPFELAQRPFLRDVTFYIATVFWTFCLLYNGKIDLYNSVGFLLLYVVYVVVVLAGRYINQKIRRTDVSAPSTNSDTKYDERSPLLAAPTEPVILGPTDENGDWIDQPLRASNEHERELRDENHHPVNEKALVEDSDSEDESEIDFTDESVRFRPFKRMWVLIRPISMRKWRKLSWIFRIVELVQAPIKFLCNLTVPVVSPKPDAKDWSRVLSVLHCVTSPMFCAVAAKGASVKLGGVFPVWGLILIIGVLLGILVWFTSTENERPGYYWVFAYIGFVASVIWTYCIANEIVNLLQTFGALLNVSNVIMGLTLLAWGNSIGDMVADVTLARQGFPRMAISACFGGPFFNLVIGIGLPCTIAVIKNGGPVLIKFTIVEAVLAGSLLLSLCFSYVSVPLRSFKMSRVYGVVLIIIYAVYLPVVILAGVGIF